MIPTFSNVANKLNDIWFDLLKSEKELQIDILDYLSKATLDIIGLVGFNYEFNSLVDDNELANAYQKLFSVDDTSNIIYRLLLMLPFITYLPTKRNRDLLKSTKIIEHTSMKLVEDRINKAKDGKLEGTDILTQLIRANQNQEGKNQMSYVELQQQIITILAAGHETSSVAITWAIHFLSKHPNIQDRLREELVEHFPNPNFAPTYDEINALEYLNCVIKETLRLVPPVPITSRTALKEDNLLGYFVPKGARIILAPAVIHQLPSFWGSDADKFNPSRWLDPKLATEVTNYRFIPFLTGPKSCIGNKLALVEIKVILGTLVRNFKFREIENFEIKKRVKITWRPSPTVKCWVSRVDE